jgi:hypothetical protein
MKVTSPKKSVARKGKATQGQAFELASLKQSARTSVALHGATVAVNAPAIRNAAPKSDVVRLNTTASLTDSEEAAYAVFLNTYAEFLIPPTTRDFASRFGVSQSRAQQYFAAFHAAGRAVNIENSGARAYLPAESFSPQWHLARLATRHGVQALQTEITKLKKG